MLAITIAVIALTCFATAAIATALYIPAVRSVAPAYRELMRAEGAAVEPARQTYWAADRRQKRLALWAIGAYAVGMLCVLPLDEARNAIHLTAICGLTLCLWVFAWFATFRKPEWEIRMEVEEEKHRKRMDDMRAQAEHKGSGK